MNHVADMNPDAQLDLTFGRRVGIAFGQRALNLNRALRGFQGAVELD
jgi:hypothetical protein